MMRNFYLNRYCRLHNSLKIFLPITLTIVFIVFNKSFCLAQGNSFNKESIEAELKALSVGEVVPPEFWTHEHFFYMEGDTVLKSLGEYQGKMLLLDFWSTWCSSCIKGFPDLESVKNKYGDKLEVLLVNSAKNRDTKESIEAHWNVNVRELKLPTILYDYYITGLFPYYAVPFYVWIDERGRVSAMTSSRFVNESIVEPLIVK